MFCADIVVMFGTFELAQSILVGEAADQSSAYTMKSKVCAVCGQQFLCGLGSGNKTCWCCDYPPIMPLDFSQNCRCPACLKEIVKEKIAEYLQNITPDNASTAIAKNYVTSSQPIEGIDYYLNEDGQFVLTAWYLLKRGYCCENGCTHCPYGHQKS